MRHLVGEWWEKRGLWMIGDALMFAIGMALLVLSLVNLLAG